MLVEDCIISVTRWYFIWRDTWIEVCFMMAKEDIENVLPGTGVIGGTGPLAKNGENPNGFA
jgi:hypothetical protein